MSRNRRLYLNVHCTSCEVELGGGYSKTASTAENTGKLPNFNIDEGDLTVFVGLLEENTLHFSVVQGGCHLCWKFVRNKRQNDHFSNVWPFYKSIQPIWRPDLLLWMMHKFTTSRLRRNRSWGSVWKSVALHRRNRSNLLLRKWLWHVFFGIRKGFLQMIILKRVK